MMPVLQPEEEEASGSSAAASPSVSTPSPSRSKVQCTNMILLISGSICFNSGRLFQWCLVLPELIIFSMN